MNEHLRCLCKRTGTASPPILHIAYKHLCKFDPIGCFVVSLVLPNPSSLQFQVTSVPRLACQVGIVEPSPFVSQHAILTSPCIFPWEPCWPNPMYLRRWKGIHARMFLEPSWPSKSQRMVVYHWDTGKSKADKNKMFPTVFKQLVKMPFNFWL